MPATQILVDANLLVLFVVGRTGREFIGKHRRLREFSADDYDRLLRVIGGVGRVVVTPNTLTETSNLLGLHKDPERSQFLQMLRFLVEHSEEVSVASVDACRSGAFLRLGLTDAVLLEIISAEIPLITVDLDLYVAASKKEPNAAFNFRHLQT